VGGETGNEAGLSCGKKHFAALLEKTLYGITYQKTENMLIFK